MRKTSKIGVTIVVTVAASVLSVGTAAAGPKPAPKTTGSVALSNPTQYLSYDAFATAPAKGSVNYTNFDFPVDGTGAWVPDAFSATFTVDGSGDQGTYAMSVSDWTPTSPTAVNFSGTGTGPAPWISTFTGAISGNALTLTMTEINGSNPAETYALTASGVIGSDGSVTGTWSDNYGTGRTGTFTIADIGHEVFHYVAPVTSASVTGQDADFAWVIPIAPLAGTTVYTHVHDGGTPGVGNDTVSFGTSPGSLLNYPLTGGNLTVFS